MGGVLVALLAPTTLFGAVPAAGQSQEDIKEALGGSPPIFEVFLAGDANGIAILTADQGTFNGFPTQGNTALIISTGDASVVDDPAKGALENVIDGDQIGTDLEGGSGVDGNDLTQVALSLPAASGGQCVSFDFLFLSEEHRNWVGTEFNDIFTASLGEPQIELRQDQIVARNNFAFGEQGELVSVNTFSGWVPGVDGSTLNARSATLSASAQVPAQGGLLYLTVQDLADSELDTAVVIDNLRYEATCPEGTEPVDTDGDGLRDEWETNGLPGLDLPAMGADPDRKDLFIELDWMYDEQCAGTVAGDPAGCVERNKEPKSGSVQDVIEAFNNAPVANPNGAPSGITLHIDAGRTSPMRPPDKNPDPAVYEPDYDAPVDTWEQWDDLSGATRLPFELVLAWEQVPTLMDTHLDPDRRDAFHYGVYANAYSDGGIPRDSSGYAGIPGAYFIVADPSVPFQPSDFGAWGLSPQDEAGTLMHEFGHNLGLWHCREEAVSSMPPCPTGQEGYQQSFVSIMNYCFQMPGIDNMGELDFNRPGVPGNCDRSGNVWNAQSFDLDEWNLIRWNDRGAIGGAAGGSASGPPATPVEATKAELVEAGLFAAPGDGAATIVGPDLFAAGVDGQSVLVDVYNPSPVESTYRVEIEEPWFDAPVEVTVGPDETGRVEVPVEVGATTNGPTPVTVSLLNGDVLRDTDTRDFLAADLTNDAVASDVRALLEQLRTNPPDGFDPDALALLEADLGPVLAGEVVPDEAALEPDLAALGDDGEGLSAGLLAAVLAGGVLLIGFVAAIVLPRRN